MVFSLCACGGKKESKIDCLNCGESISEGVSFCEHCGAKITNTDNENSNNSNKDLSSTENTTEETSEPASSTENTSKPSTNNKPSSSTSKPTTSTHAHSYSKNVTSATCSDSGYTTYTCSCGDSYISDYTDAKGHTEVIDKAVAATTSTTGLTEGKHCSVCKTVLVAQQVTPKLELSPSDKTTLTIKGIGNTYNYYLGKQLKSSTYIHDVKYNMVTTPLNTINIYINFIMELTYDKSKVMCFRWEIYDSNSVCVASGNIFENATTGTKYNIERLISIDEPGDYTFKFIDVGTP